MEKQKKKMPRGMKKYKKCEKTVCIQSNKKKTRDYVQPTTLGKTLTVMNCIRRSIAGKWRLEETWLKIEYKRIPR